MPKPKTKFVDSKGIEIESEIPKENASSVFGEENLAISENGHKDSENTEVDERIKFKEVTVEELLQANEGLYYFYLESGLIKEALSGHKKPKIFYVVGNKAKIHQQNIEVIASLKRKHLDIWFKIAEKEVETAIDEEIANQEKEEKAEIEKQKKAKEATKHLDSIFEYYSHEEKPLLDNIYFAGAISGLTKKYSRSEIDFNDCQLGENGITRLAKVLGERADNSIMKLLLRGNNITKDLADTLFSELVIAKKDHDGKSKLVEIRQGSLREIDVSNNPIGNEGFFILLSALGGGPNLIKLNLGYTGLNDGGIKKFFDALPESKKLESLILSGNKIAEQEAIEALAIFLEKNKALKEIRLDDCGITKEGSKKLIEVLLGKLGVFEKNHKNLEVIDFSGNEIGDDGIKGLDALLMANEGLQELHLNNCKITEAGIKSVIKRLLGHKDLRVLSINGIEILEQKTTELLWQLKKQNPSLSIFGGGKKLQKELEAKGKRAAAEKTPFQIKLAEIAIRKTPILDFILRRKDRSINEVDLTEIELDDKEALELGKVLEKKNVQIKKLSLASEKITNLGIKAIVAGLLRSGQKSIKSIDISKSKIGSDGAWALESVCNKKNKSLEELNLNGCEVESESFKKLTEVLYKNKNFKKLNIEGLVVTNRGRLKDYEEDLIFPLDHPEYKTVIEAVANLKMENSSLEIVCDKLVKEKIEEAIAEKNLPKNEPNLLSNEIEAVEIEKEDDVLSQPYQAQEEEKVYSQQDLISETSEAEVINKKDFPSSSIRESSVVRIEKNDFIKHSIWEPNHQKEGARKNNYRFLKSGELKNDEAVEKQTEEILINILISIACKQNLSSEEIIDMTKAAAESGGIANKLKENNPNNIYKKRLDNKLFFENSELKFDPEEINKTKKFSSAFQKKCFECGIYSGRESVDFDKIQKKELGLRLTFLPDSVLQKFKEIKDLQSSKSDAKTAIAARKEEVDKMTVEMMTKINSPSRTH